MGILLTSSSYAKKRSHPSQLGQSISRLSSSIRWRFIGDENISILVAIKLCAREKVMMRKRLKEGDDARGRDENR